MNSAARVPAHSVALTKSASLASVELVRHAGT